MTETTDKKQPDNIPTKKSSPSNLIAITGVLSILLIVSIALFFNQKSKMVEMETILTHEKDSLVGSRVFSRVPGFCGIGDHRAA